MSVRNIPKVTETIVRQKSVTPTLRHIVELTQKDGKGKKTAKLECKALQ